MAFLVAGFATGIVGGLFGVGGGESSSPFLSTCSASLNMRLKAHHSRSSFHPLASLRPCGTTTQDTSTSKSLVFSRRGSSSVRTSAHGVRLN